MKYITEKFAKIIKMSYNIAINGFGRIGRLVFRRALDVGNKVTVINNPGSTIDYLL